MFKFDVKYTIDLYYDYYKDALVKSKIVRDIIFALLFIGVAVYWWVDTSDATQGNTLPIFGTILGVLFPLMNFVSLPSLKKQLNARKDDIDRTHLTVTFTDEKIIYENLTEPKKEEVKLETKVEETKVEETKEDTTQVEETKEESPVEETKQEEVKETTENKEEAKEEQRVFDLAYENFAYVKEIKTSIVFYLDRQTIIILPKESMVEGTSLDDFKAFVQTKLPKKCKFYKNK